MKSNIMFTLLTVFIFSIPVFGGIQSKNVNLSSGAEIVNDDSYIAQDEVNLSCTRLLGKGLIKGRTLTIVADEFSFTGSLVWKEKCTIITTQPFSKNICTFSGPGEPDITVNPELVKEKRNAGVSKIALPVPPKIDLSEIDLKKPSPVFPLASTNNQKFSSEKCFEELVYQLKELITKKDFSVQKVQSCIQNYQEKAQELGLDEKEFLMDVRNVLASYRIDKFRGIKYFVGTSCITGIFASLVYLTKDWPHRSVERRAHTGENFDEVPHPACTLSLLGVLFTPIFGWQFYFHSQNTRSTVLAGEQKQKNLIKTLRECDHLVSMGAHT